MPIFLAGLPVTDDGLLELARLVEDPLLADRLEAAYARQTKILALDVAERQTIIAALEEPPPSSPSLGPCSYRNTSAASATGSSSTRVGSGEAPA